MKFNIPYLPERTKKPRKEKGITMIMDKGLSCIEVKGILESCFSIVDYVKFGFGTSYLAKDLKEKIKLYKQANVKCYLGGTLFEVFIARGMFNEYKKLIEELELDVVEVSDGCIAMEKEEKVKYIKELSQYMTVFSEVGSKDSSVVLKTNCWIEKMNIELEAGAKKVIAEAREGGNIGIYDSSGTVRQEMIDSIANEVGNENIIWETPIKSQQVYFIKKFGANVNLGNIHPQEITSLETLRLGLRGDTFFDFLPPEIKNKYK